MSKKKPQPQEQQSPEARLKALEERVGKQVWWAAIAAVIAALLGSSGVAGILAVSNQRSVQRAEARLKDAEAASKELQVACDRHAKGMDAMNRIIQELRQTGDKSKADEVRLLMLQQEADFQQFLQGMRQSMRVMWENPGSRTGAAECDRVLVAAADASAKRHKRLQSLLQNEK